ncbi:hypothetical protein BGZ70_004014 [Mortierella alpina]|uniref:Nuclear segregation protein BFR1 n=1 Tax=Mortierella alpina TaxID=64518 RepID=A0A9P6IRF2_MORAP|nr:hypothetical protein BGZ70_004014 [Mortierella alpina]
MSITETASSTAISSAAGHADTTQKKARSFVKKPSQEEKTKALKEIDDKLARLRPQLDAVREAIASVTDKTEVDPRTSLRKRLSELREQQAASKKGKQAKIDELNVLNAALKKKITDLKVLNDKLPFKTTEAVDAQISALTKQVESGKIKLVEEKRFLCEISTLTKSKKSVAAAQAQQVAIDEDKKAIVSLREAMNDQASSAQSDEYNAIQAQLDEITKAKDEVWKKRNELFDERTRLQKEIEVEHQRKKAVNDEYFAAVQEHSKLLQEEQVRRREEFQHKKQLDLEEKRLAIAKEERDLAEIPAFQTEIITCDSVHKYLLQFSHDQKRMTEEVKAEGGSPAQPSGATIRQADMTANVPAGVMLAKKADKVEEVFFVCNAKSKKNKGLKEKKKETASLTLPFAVVEQLVELKISVPTSSADVRKTLDALSEMSSTFKANQAKATAENKRRAEERIAKLALSAEQSVDIDSIVEQTEIVAEIEATACKWRYL